MRRLVGGIPLGQDLLVVEGTAGGHVGLVGIAVERDEGVDPGVVAGTAVGHADREAVAHLRDGPTGQGLDSREAAVVEGLLDPLLDAVHGDLALDVVREGLGRREEVGEVEGDQQGQKGDDGDGESLAHGATSGLMI